MEAILKRGRPRKDQDISTVRVNVMLPEQTYIRAARLAKEMGISEPEAIRRLLDLALAASALTPTKK